MKFVCDFRDELGSLAERVGARGRALAEMAHLGVPVPPGFAVSDVVCRRFLETGDIPGPAWDEISAALDRSVAAISATDHDRPVLFSVRSSPSTEMPSVFNSALYLGATEESLERLALWGGAQLAANVRLGFLKSIGRLRGLSPARYTGVVAEIVGPAERGSWSLDQIEAVCDAYEALVVDESQRPIPHELSGQVLEGIEAVFASWNRREARRFRRSHEISDDDGMGIVVHPMILGEAPFDSGAGIAYSRDPGDGSPGVTGIYTDSVSRPRSQASYPGLVDLLEASADAHAAVLAVTLRLEAVRRDMVRLDFVRERGSLWVIEARPADRSIEAAVRCAVDLVDEGVISRDEALHRVDAEQLAGMLHPRLDGAPTVEPIAIGTPASPGAATGGLVFSAEAAIAAAEGGDRAILAVREVLPRDLDGVVSAAGLITSHGGGTSHAAVAARGAGTPSVTGLADVVVNDDAIRFAGTTLSVGDVVTIDGVSGAVFTGELPISQPPAASYLDRLLEWADEVRRLGVWANADTARAATAARAAGAEGIGLARTEYMFHGERLAVVRRILLSEDGRDQAEALEELESLQVEDFEELLEAMDGTPVVVRLLDPPVHEFLPSRIDVDKEMVARRLAGEEVGDLERLDAAIEQWSEVNPMLGLRGVRLAVVIPEIYRVQVLAALESVRRRLDAGGDPRLAIMVPLVSSVEELHLVRDMIEEEVHSAGRLLELAIGTMIELPRAALMAGDLALESDFFSFGTNDLTQTTMGLSRDDAEEAFLRSYVEQGLMSVNPFQRIDHVGVGSLIKQAIATGREANPGLEIGVCGEHGGDPISIGYFHRWGVDYVSCSPPRLPIARLAAAQAALDDVE
ncbi:MAG: PEP/pyruvate-binding domain-containing protein [Acidimicrobiia bacterium]|nr:PEP/pyruvate-binding domain-containing protein [Acidimicrobiia bacterium]MDX2466988.1 PEP/pyruvate-binding domain-containing protein [Acidimicrobiia bacterium]